MTQIYPNPAQESIFINSPTTVQVALTDILGRKILSQTIQQKGEINVSNLQRGLYFLEITTKNNARIVKKIILE